MPLVQAARAMRPHAAKAASLLKSLGNEQRLMILCHLVSGPMSVGQLHKRMSLSQSSLSQHLGILRESGAVTTRRRSQRIIYSLPPGTVTGIIGLVHERFCPGGSEKSTRSPA